MSAPKVKVTAYKGQIVIEPIDPEKDVEKGWFPTGGSRIGCVLVPTGQRLAASEEALALLQTIKVGHDAIGDVDWFRCSKGPGQEDGDYAFAWFGPLFRIVNPKTAEAARAFKVYRDQCTIIPNDPPDAAKKVIDEHPTAAVWKEPHRL